MSDYNQQQPQQPPQRQEQQQFSKGQQNSVTGAASSISESVAETPDKYDAEIADNADKAHRHNNDLLRTVTQYTEYSVTTGEAMNDELRRVRSKKECHEIPEKEPTNVYNLFSKQFLGLKFFKPYITTILILLVFMFCVFSIYWGSFFQRNKRLVNLKVLVALEPSNADNDLLSQALREATEVSPVNKLAGWHINTDGLSESEIIRKVHHQKYWGAIYVSQQDASSQLASAFSNGSSFNTSSLVKAYYESGRDPNGMKSYVEPAINRFSGVYSSILRQKVFPSLISGLSSSELSTARSNGMLTSYPTIDIVDGRPMKDPVLMAPLQVGLIYLILISFFQILWNTNLNGYVAKTLNPMSFIGYRMIIAQVTFLILSLVVTTLNRAFQVDFNNTWKGGFGVGWMIHYLTLSAVGGANENIMLIVLPIVPLGGFWLMFFIILNVSATFSPIETCPKLFRFAYAMPIKNAYELMKILFFDTYRGHIGRYFGILVAWVVLNNILMPFCLMFFSFKMKRAAAKMAKAKVAEEHKA
ncbi:unnamed protein product [Ambrosiozyma monospora]|uniref:Unnamed protein product n=1 Tax=Ambrosiozyma monospora TaxID=43982 RepID=A0A9W7DGC4_AMBMO|nr:unnamed protein product [Ambrosiozyma monospora]